MRSHEGGRGAADEQAVLVARAKAAIDVTPLSVAAAEGVDHRALNALLHGGGRTEDAQRLARAFGRRSAELRALARELTAAAG